MMMNLFMLSGMTVTFIDIDIDIVAHLVLAVSHSM